jgi:hypothetical protein
MSVSILVAAQSRWVIPGSFDRRSTKMLVDSKA